MMIVPSSSEEQLIDVASRLLLNLQVKLVILTIHEKRGVASPFLIASSSCLSPFSSSLTRVICRAWTSAFGFHISLAHTTHLETISPAVRPIISSAALQSACISFLQQAHHFGSVKVHGGFTTSTGWDVRSTVAGPALAKTSTPRCSTGWFPVLISVATLSCAPALYYPHPRHFGYCSGLERLGCISPCQSPPLQCHCALVSRRSSHDLRASPAFSCPNVLYRYLQCWSHRPPSAPQCRHSASVAAPTRT